MIRESFHFHFAGRKSTDFGIINVRVEEGLFSEQIVANRTINEVYIRGRKEPYFTDVSEEPKSIRLRFSFLEPWNDKLIDEIIRWLNVYEYKPLYFEGDIDRIYYAMPVDGIDKMHNGLKSGYLELTMRTNSGKSYSHDIMTRNFNTKIMSETQGTDLPIIKIGNRGHFSTFPKIWIEKIEEGDLVIFNKTNENQEFRFKNIDIGEKIFVDCAKEIIKTNKVNTYRYDDFNDNYLKLIYGENYLAVSNNMKIKFSYKYIFS